MHKDDAVVREEFLFGFKTALAAVAAQFPF